MGDQADESGTHDGGVHNVHHGDVANLVQAGEIHYHVWHLMRPLLDSAGSNYLTEAEFRPGEDVEIRRAALAERIATEAIHHPEDFRAALSRPVGDDEAVPAEPDRFDEALALLGLVVQRMSEQRVAQQAQTDVSERIAVELIELKLAVARQLPPPRSMPAEDGSVEPPRPGECPYPGLAAFTPSQTRWFFGREKMIAQLLQRLARSHASGTPLFVVGVSGAGKSSLLRAGLLPALIRGELTVPGSADWPHMLVRPGATPLAELVTHAATRIGTSSITALDQVREDPKAFATLLREAAHVHAAKRNAEPGRFVLIVDQFEEIFTHCTDAAERAAFIAALRAATSHALVVLGLRADFFQSCADQPGLADVLQDNQFLVGPMTTDELRGAIEQPAVAVGIEVEPGLAALMLADLGSQPGALPLLGYALRATWEMRRGSAMTLASYQEAGGVRSAIATAAETMFAHLSEPEQETARRLLLRLVAVGDGVEDTRRRLPKSELIGTDHTASVVLDRLVSTRLVTVTRDDVEIVHEALLHAWPRLAGWLRTDRPGLLVRRRLADAVRAWLAVDRDPGSVYRGAQLADLRAWLPEWQHDLSPDEQQFVDLSIAAEQAELDLVRRRNRTLRRGLVAMACLVVIALVAGGIAVWQQQVANAQRETALSGQYGTESLSPGNTDPRRSLLLAAAAWQASPTDQARTAVLSAQAQRYNGTLGPVADRIWRVALTPDGATAVIAEYGGTVTFWDTASRQQIAQLTGPDGVPDIAISPDGNTIAIARLNNTLQLWDLHTHQLVRTLPGNALRVAFNANGRYLLSTYGPRVFLWDLATGQTVRAYGTGGSNVAGVAISHNGRVIAAGAEDGTVHLWDAAAGTELAVLTGHTKIVGSVDFNRDDSLLASAGQDGTIRLWDVAARKPAAVPVLTPPVRGDSSLQALFSPDGTEVAAAMNVARSVQWWRVSDGAAVDAYYGHTLGVAAIAFSRDGHTLLTGGVDRTAMLWKVRTTFLPEPDPVRVVAFSPDGRVLAASNGSRVSLWDPQHGDLIRVLPGSEGDYDSMAMSPDGTTVATTPPDGTVKLWNVATGTAVRTIPVGPGLVADFVSYSPDGRTLAVVEGPTPDMVTSGAVTPPYAFVVLQYDTASGEQVGLTSYLINRPSLDPFPNARAVFSPDGKLLAVPLVNGVIDLREARTGQQVAQLPGQGTAFGLAFNADGSMLASGTTERTIQLWDVTARKRIGEPMTGHNGSVRDLAFLPDGHTLASVGDNDTAVRLWDVDGRAPKGWIQGAGGSLQAIAVQPGTGMVATAAVNSTVDVWQTDLGKVQDQICTALRGQQSVSDAWAGLREDPAQAPHC